MSKNKQVIRMDPTEFSNSISNALNTKVDVEGRSIYIFGEITGDVAYAFMVAFRKLDETDGSITIVLNSEGGSVEDGFAIYDTIRLARNDTYIEGYGAIQSIAAVILQAGTLRALAPNVSFMIHDGSLSFNQITVSSAAITALSKEMKRNTEQYYGILSYHSGNPIKRIEKMCHEETYLSAHDAVELGFADVVLGEENDEKTN